MMVARRDHDGIKRAHSASGIHGATKHRTPRQHANKQNMKLTKYSHHISRDNNIHAAGFLAGVIELGGTILSPAVLAFTNRSTLGT